MTPSPSQPGSELGQLTAVDAYLSIPASYRKKYPTAAWRAAREAVLPHARRPSIHDLPALARPPAPTLPQRRL